jgi:putative ABC transport system substrate-binding protein
MVGRMDHWALLLRYLPSFLLIIVSFSSFPAVSSADKIPIGVILTGDIPYYREIHESLVERLNAEGYGPDKIEIILQKPIPNSLSWTNAVRKLVAFEAQVIISYGAPATLTAVNESSGSPVVFAGVYKPVETGISMKNATGISSEVPVVSILRKLRAIADYSKLGIIYSASEKDTVMQAREAKALAEKINFTPQMIDLAKKKGAVDLSGIDALFMTTSCAGMRCIDDIIGLARKGGIPTATSIGGSAARGVLLTISANTQEQGVAAASMVAAILNGTHPSAIASKRATKIDFVVNLKEANSLGLEVPFDLLTSATRVIK